MERVTCYEGKFNLEARVDSYSGFRQQRQDKAHHSPSRNSNHRITSLGSCSCSDQTAGTYPRSKRQEIFDLPFTQNEPSRYRRSRTAQTSDAFYEVRKKGYCTSKCSERSFHYDKFPRSRVHDDYYDPNNGNISRTEP